MNSDQEDHFGMHLKVDLFLVTNASALAFNPAIATNRTSLNSFINLTAQSDSTATRDITGFTAAKNEHRAQQIAQLKLVRAGMMGYYVVNPDIKNSGIVSFNDGQIDKFRDTELYMRTDQVLDLALPVKALLTPYGVSAAQVDALDTLNGLWLAMESIGRQEEWVNKASGEDVDRYMAKTTGLLTKTIDVLMKVVQYNDPNLYSQYTTARMIDDTGGGSDSQGYIVQTFTVPGGGSIILPLTSGAPDPTLQVYLRAINGDAIVCTTNLPANPCTNGFELLKGETFKGTIGSMNLDALLQNVQVTNPGLSPVIIRAGIKEA